MKPAAAWWRWIVLAGIVLAGLGAAPWALAQGSFFRVSPGPLSESHAEHDNSDGCGKCHEANKGVTNAKCLDCHKPLRERIARKVGLHATFKGKCIECHPGHKGRTTSIIDWKHVGGQQTFKHELTGFELTNHHGQIACTACHTKRMKSGRISYLGLERECGGCHQGVHKLAKSDLSGKCDLCHQAGKVNRGMRLSEWAAQHQERTKVVFTGKHLEQPCTKCHPKAEMSSRTPPRGCPDCHRPSHPSTPPVADCGQCHKPGQPWKERDHRPPPLRLHAPRQAPEPRLQALPRCGARRSPTARASAPTVTSTARPTSCNSPTARAIAATSRAASVRGRSTTTRTRAIPCSDSTPSPTCAPSA